MFIKEVMILSNNFYALFGTDLLSFSHASWLVALFPAFFALRLLYQISLYQLLQVTRLVHARLCQAQSKS